MSGSGRLPVADRAGTRRAVVRLVRADRRGFLVVLGLTCAAAAAGLVAPWLVGRIVDAVEDGRGVSAVDLPALGVLGAALAQLLLVRFARRAAHRFGERVLLRLRGELVDRLLGLPARTVERLGGGDLMVRATGDPALVGTALSGAVPEVLVASVQIVFLLAAVFLVHPLLGLCGLVGLPAVVLVSRWYLRRAREAYLEEGAARSASAEELAATTAGAAAVEAHRLRERRVAAGDLAVGRTFRAQMRTLRLRSGLFPVVDTSHSLPVAAALLAGGTLVASGELGTGAAVAAVLYLVQLAGPVDTVMMVMEQLQQSGAALARIEGVGSLAEEEAAAPESEPERRGGGGSSAGARGGSGEVRLEGVRFRYPDGPEVLHGVDLTVRPGERLAVVGPSGAGKTTLGRLVAGLDVPGSGAVRLDGRPVEAAGRRVLMVTQEHHVFLGTLRENLAMAAEDAPDEVLAAALRTVGGGWVDGLADTLADGLDTEVGPEGGEEFRLELSPGRAQQVALARVVLADPAVVVLDEATAVMGPRAARAAERALGAALAGRTVIAIAHRLSTAHDADRVAVVDGGRVVELGPHEELVRAGGPYGVLWRGWHGGETA